jgi:ubiquitin-conjugating enzyme E2 variant
VHLQHLLDLLGLASVAAVTGHLTGTLLAALRGPAAWAAAAAGLLLGYLAADLTSAVIHWLGDRYGSPQTPFFGPRFIHPFREHHVNPQAITAHDFVEVNGNTSLALAPALALGSWLVLPAAEGAWLSFASALALAWSLILVASNQFHSWAHMDRAPALARFLQRWHLILTPEGHARHHTPPYDKYFCAAVGWVDPVLERFAVFPRLERAIAWFTTPGAPRA